jgi:hypothetical protein
VSDIFVQPDRAIKAWWFGNATLGYGDGARVIVGQAHWVEQTSEYPIECCKHGLHGSVKLTDALDLATGPLLHRVHLWGYVARGSNKVAAEYRFYEAALTEAQTTALLQGWARWCALQVIHLWDCPAVVKQWLETGDPSLKAAAKAAVWAAARDAAWAAARAAARDAARAAARAAARDAAWAAARAAARAAVWAAAWDAAKAAARAAARDAARAAQEAELVRLALARLDLA